MQPVVVHAPAGPARATWRPLLAAYGPVGFNALLGVRGGNAPANTSLARRPSEVLLRSLAPRKPGENLAELV